MAAAFDEAVQGAGDDLAGAGAAEHPRHNARDQAAGAAVFHCCEDARQQAGERSGGWAGGGRIGQEAMQDAGQVEPGQNIGDFLGGKDVGRDEAAERGAEPLLLPRDDGGVRDGDAKRVAEQRGDREPVGDAADESGLGAAWSRSVAVDGGRA